MWEGISGLQKPRYEERDGEAKQNQQSKHQKNKKVRSTEGGERERERERNLLLY